MPSVLTRIRNGIKAVFGHYEAAKNQFFRSWLPGSLQAARFDYTPSSRRELQRKSRYWERNNALVQRLADLFEEYTVGVGIGFYPASDDKEWNDQARAYWVEWELYADFYSSCGFNILQQLAARALVFDGEAFFILTHDDDGRPQVQMLEADRCSTPDDRRQEEGSSVVDGVAIDDAGRPTGYWFSEDVTGSGVAKKSWRLVPREFVVHIFEASRPGQYRGIPMLHAVLNDIHDLDDLQIMESKAARDGAEITNVIKNKSGTADVGDLIAQGGVVPAGSMTQAQKRTYYESTVGGRTFFMQHDDDIEQLKVERPSGSTREYWVLLENKICAGVGIPRQLIYSESLQGTVQRSVLDIAAAWFRIRSTALIRGFAQVYFYALEYGIQTEANLADRPGKWRRFTWRPPRAPNVDVGRNASAMLAELAAGTTNYKRIFAELGLDYVEELTQKADEAVLLDSLAKARGISVDRIAAQSLPAATAETLSDPEDEMVIPSPS